MTDTPPGVRTWGLADTSLRTAQFAACLLLIVQYLLGMAVNLFVKIPTHHPGALAHSYFLGVVDGIQWVIAHGQFWLILHATLGLALVMAAFAVAVAASRTGGRAAAITSGIGVLTILGAGFNGASFLNYGEDFSSMIMAGLWAIALGSYITGLYLTPLHHRAVRDPGQLGN